MNTHYSAFELITVCHILAAVCVVVKILMVVNKRGFTMVPVVWSFFTIYSRDEIASVSNQHRKTYMRINNIINCYLYLWVMLLLLLLVVDKATSSIYSTHM